jgi:uncharacterized membrane protein YbhN (UPF0104 family)
MVVYGSFSLALEAISLVRMVGLPLTDFSAWTAAKIKAASYLAYTIHYSLGVGALSILLRRRVQLSLADSAGVVLLIAAFDLGMTILVASFGALLLGAETQAVRAGIIFGAAATMVGGFVVLRAPFSLGPLDRLREFTVFRATRETPVAKIAELFMLRLVFVLGFFAVAAVSLRIFGIDPPIPVLFVNVSIVALVSALPIAVAGLGTGQLAFVYVFRDYGDPETLLACSLALSAGLILLRAGMGLSFAREFAREAIRAAREEEA